MNKENGLIRFKVKVFYRFMNAITCSVFCEIIEIACGSRVAAKRYAEADFLDMVSENCPDFQAEILGIRINQTMSSSGIACEIKEYEKRLMENEKKKLEEFLRNGISKLKPRLKLEEFFRENGIVGYSQLVDNKEPVLEFAKKCRGNGIGEESYRKLRKVCNNEDWKYW